MRLHEIVQAVALALTSRPGRVSVVASRLREAGLISRCEGSRRYAESVPPDEIALLFIASTVESNLGTAAATATAFARLANVDGTTFAQAVEQMLFGDVSPADLAIRLDPPSVSIQFQPDIAVAFGSGAPSVAVSAKFVPAAKIAELRAALKKETK